MHGETLDTMSATVTRKSINVKFNAKINVPIGHFMLPLLMLTSEVLNLSIHSLISLFVPHVGEILTIRTVRNTQNFELFDKKND